MWVSNGIATAWSSSEPAKALDSCVFLDITVLYILSIVLKAGQRAVHHILRVGLDEAYWFIAVISILKYMSFCNSLSHWMLFYCKRSAAKIHYSEYFKSLIESVLCVFPSCYKG